MENILKKPYEISIWEDYTPTDSKQFYQERKLMIIGSDTMTARLRANNPVFTENVNGTHTLSFTLYSQYFDEDTGDFIDNPFLPYMVNERKVKLNYDDEWYDFVIKSIEEDSESNSFSYSCTDSFINELSKNGFSIELDTELENNQGTIGELAAVVLDGTDWQVGHVDLLVQTNDEALYAVTIPSGTTIVGTDMDTLLDDEPTTITITSATTSTGTEVAPIIYVFYSCAIDSTIPMQFLYREDGNYTIDEDGLVNNSPNYLLTEGEITVDTSNGAVNDFRGQRIVQKEVTKYDSLTDNYITVYEDTSGNELYMFYENEYISPTLVVNYVANSINFTSTSGWTAPSPLTVKNIIYPFMYTSDYATTNFVPYMRLLYSEAKPIYNSGITSNASYMSSGIAQGQYFVLRLKYGISSEEDGQPLTDSSDNLRAKVAIYSLDTDGNYNFDGDDEVISFISSTPIYESDVDSDSGLSYVYYLAQATQSLSYSDLISTKSPVGLFFSLQTPDTSNYYFIQEAQFFPYVLDSENEIVFPGDTPSSCVKKIYYYYYPSLNTNATDADDISYAYIDYEKSSDYTVKYDKTFEKIRSITTSESNRFNIIQTLCETFECWPRFEIEHDSNGAITITDDGPQKTVNFYEYIGNDNYSGFKYGINLKSIKRTLDSEQIVSKIIVKPNSNEYGIDGYCSIARATENPTGENFLLNFRYYTQQGLLDSNEVNNDLYLYTEGGKYLGYYVQLHKLNSAYDEYITEYSLIATTLTNLEAAYTSYKTAYDAAVAEINEAKTTIQNYCGVSYETLMSDETTYERYLGNTEIQDLVTEIQSWTAQAVQFQAYYEQKDVQIQAQELRQEEIKTLWEEILVEKDELEYKFYQKYSKYIQEGSWISEDYMDDNLYYLDAESVLYTSAFPEVTYTIDVLELSQLEEYENYSFSVGDKTYIEDVEFFGYTSIDGVKTPYQEEVILSEVTYNLDDPSQNKITVQNYKTQFEDLFQRITATTQSLQYQTGSYSRAASSFTTDGTITTSALQNSLINNSLIISNATDQSVVWDETGITITNLSKPNEIVRLVSGGILITSDGGDTWSAGITGSGINTSYLTAGQIDTSEINIISGGYPCFRWDSNGISAYRFSIDETTQTPVYFQFNNFVRLDQYGIYGINHDSDFVADSIEDVEEYAQFGLTWNGFFLRSDHTSLDQSVDGRIEISTDEDFQVIDGNEIERIKIGLLDTTQNEDGSYTGHFGLRISDGDGNPVLATNDEGMLWLTQRIVIGPDYALGDTYYSYRAWLGIDEQYHWAAGTGPLASTAEVPYSKILSVRNGDENNTETLAIYDTGTLYATGAEIHGDIYATGGQIGNLSIESLTENLTGVSLTSLNGVTIKEATDGTLTPSTMQFIPSVTGAATDTITIYWLYSTDGNTFHQFETTIIGTDLDDDGNEFTSDGILEIASSDLYSYFNTSGVVYIRATVLDVGYDTVVLTILKDASLEDADVNPYNIIPSYTQFYKYASEGDDGEEVLTFSPNEISLKSYKGQEDTEALTSDTIDYNLYIYSDSVNYYNSSSDKWIKLNGQIDEVTYDDSGTAISSGNLVDSPFNNYAFFSTDDTYYIQLAEFYNSNIASDYFFDTVSEIIENDNTVIKVELINIETDEILANTTINVVFGTSSSMASFALTAANIQAAVQQAKLVFDAEGLHITNGGFDITTEVVTEDEDGDLYTTEEVLLSIQDGELYLNGNGTFTGTINATDGVFNGTIYATAGTLSNLSVTGLLNIGDNIVINGVSTDDNPYIGIYSLNYDPDGDTGFYISDTGEIIANQLTLGAGASIKKYIQLGNAWLINPTWLNNELASESPDSVVTENNLTSNSVLVVKEVIDDETTSASDLINIKQTGIITIGRNSGIVIDGTTESLYSFNYEDGNKGWSITPNEAEFNNITARGSIKAVAFEYETNSVQSIGGILLVKPSSAINSVTVEEESDDSVILRLITETEVNFGSSDYAKISHSLLQDYLFTATNDEDEANTILVIIPKELVSDDFDYEVLVGSPILNMGGPTSPSIVINGSESDSLYPKSSLSIFENGINDDDGYDALHPTTKLVLGQMPTEVVNKTFGIFNSTSYGLYAENVFLKGSLISEGQNNALDYIYSGMNTNSTIEFSDTDKQYFSESGYIILWAGAPWSSETNQIDIQNANFKVDNLGNLYANSGYFVGTIITDATITASKIRTAEIEGYQYKDENDEVVETVAALSIKNADIGITFDTDTDTVMQLSTDGLNLYRDLNVGDNFTIRSDSSLVVPITLFSKTRASSEDITVITPNKIGFVTVGTFPSSETEYDNLSYNSYISNNTDGLSIFEKNIAIASFKNNDINLKQSTRVGGQMITFYDEQGDRVRMQTVIDSDDGIIGYDLYID